MNPTLKILAEKKLIGKRLQMSLVNNKTPKPQNPKTPELWNLNFYFNQSACFHFKLLLEIATERYLLGRTWTRCCNLNSLRLIKLYSFKSCIFVTAIKWEASAIPDCDLRKIQRHFTNSFLSPSNFAVSKPSKTFLISTNS